MKPLALLTGSLLLAAAPRAAALSYVESSTGLSTPALEGGRTEVEMGDVNGDGNVDLVSIGDHGSPFVNTSEHGIMVWFGDGHGAWSVVQTGDFGYGGVALGDVNGDGAIDAGYGMHHNYASGDLGDQILEVALGDGTGTAWVAWDDGLATNGETWGMFGSDFADFDADGDLDLASNSFGCCAGVHVYLNQGDGTWVQSFGFTGGNSTQDLATGDVNGDGFADIAVAHQSQTVYLGDGAGGFTGADGNLPPGGNLGRKGPSLGDVDGDGGDDLAVVTSTGGVAVWRWNGPGNWVSASGGLPASGTYEMTQLFDMDGDGLTDLVAFGRGLLTVWRGDGAGQWTQATSLSTPTPGYLSALRVGGDADHNGFPDIALIDEEGPIFSSRNKAHFYKEATAPSALAIRPVRPRPASTLRAGAAAFIDWIAAVPGGETGTVALELSVSGPGGPWTPIASGLANGGRHQWVVPPASSADCYVRTTVTTGAGSASAITAGAFTIAGGAAGVAAGGAPPAPQRLTAAPNPFVSSTRFTLPSPAPVRLRIYDAAGRLVRALVTGEVEWDGRDAAGRAVPRGVYLVRLESGLAAPAPVIRIR